MKTFQQFQENKLKAGKFALEVGKRAAKQVAPSASFFYGLFKLPKLKKNIDNLRKNN
tara:strand:+ start:544 stop:714 length:171 start_codon:yes stop_codon:yes gene_type:complete